MEFGLIQVADLRVRVVCMSQDGRKMIESHLRTGLRPGSSYLDKLGSIWSPAGLRWSQTSSQAARELDSVMEFDLYSSNT